MKRTSRPLETTRGNEERVIELVPGEKAGDEQAAYLWIGDAGGACFGTITLPELRELLEEAGARKV